MSAVERAAEVLAAHSIGAFSGSETACACDRWWRPNAEYRQHVAEALAAAGLLAEPTDQRETRTEWALQRPSGRVEYLHPREEFVRLQRSYEYSKTTIVRREVGPWVEVPS